MRTARDCVLFALTKVTDQKSYSNIALDQILKKAGLDQRDKNFATAVFYGTLERKITLDYCIAHYSSKPLEEITPMVRDILRLSLYQMLYMDHVPENAAVNEGVELTKKNKIPEATGFVNAVLRSFLRGGAVVPPIIGDIGTQLSVLYSCEPWLCDKLVEEYGLESAHRILDTSTGMPPTYLRVNRQKTTPEQLQSSMEAQGITLLPTTIEDCMLAEGGGNLVATPEFDAGYFHVQDMSSQLCANAMISYGCKRVADVCAAPGGKTFTMAQLLSEQGEVLALDLHESRVKLIRSGAERLGLHNIQTGVQDASVYNPELGEFDGVLCDVPCSGFGILRRKPEIKYKTWEDIKKLPEIQRNILENSAQYVKLEGILIYSTCSILKEENQQVVDGFLEENPNFSPYPSKEEYCTTFLPDKQGSDGFFISKLIRNK